MTPAILEAEKAGIAFSVRPYHHDPRIRAYGGEVVEALGLGPDRVFKTLVCELDGDPRRLAVSVIPVSRQLDLKAAAAALGAKKAAMAQPKDAERATGYVVGGISPLGQRRRLPMVVDDSALGWDTVFVSGGRRGLELELKPADLVRLAWALAAAVTV